MTTISVQDISKLARLARLDLSSDELVKYATEITTILSFVDKLQDVDTEGLEPTYQVTGLENITRPDEVINYMTTQESLLKNAPDIEKDLFKVRRMVG